MKSKLKSVQMRQNADHNNSKYGHFSRSVMVFWWFHGEQNLINSLKFT